jgi:hypothetical protein
LLVAFFVTSSVAEDRTLGSGSAVNDDDAVDQVLASSELPWWVAAESDKLADSGYTIAGVDFTPMTGSTLRERKRAKMLAARAAARAIAAASATQTSTSIAATAAVPNMTNGFCLPAYTNVTTTRVCQAPTQACNRRYPCCSGSVCRNRVCRRLCVAQQGKECSLNADCCSAVCVSCSPLQCQGRCGLGVELPKDNIQVRMNGEEEEEEEA